MTTIRWAILFFVLLGIIKFLISNADRKFHEEEMKKMRETKKEFLKKHNMTNKQLQDMIDKWID